MTCSQEAETWGDLLDPDAQTEWCINPIKIGGGEVRRECYGAAFRTPLTVLADQIAD